MLGEPGLIKDEGLRPDRPGSRVSRCCKPRIRVSKQGESRSKVRQRPAGPRGSLVETSQSERPPVGRPFRGLGPSGPEPEFAPV